MVGGKVDCLLISLLTCAQATIPRMHADGWVLMDFSCFGTRPYYGSDIIAAVQRKLHDSEAHMACYACDEHCLSLYFGCHREEFSER